MPSVNCKGPGAFTELRVTAKPVNFKGSLMSKDRGKLDGFVVPWGFFYYQEGNKAKKQLVTDSLNSCFAIVCHHLKTNKIFFAHVSNQTETKSITDAIKKANPTKDGYTCIIVMGVGPQEGTTVKRINQILKEADYPFHVYQSTYGAVAYNLDGTLSFGDAAKEDATEDPEAMEEAKKFTAKGPLRKMKDCLALPQ